MRKIGSYSLAVSNVTLAELYFGAYNSSKVEANLRRIGTFKKHLTVYSDSEESAECFGKFKVDLKKKGRPIEDFDLLIASIAFVNGCILVTNNIQHFDRIDGLITENWLEAG